MPHSDFYFSQDEAVKELTTASTLDKALNALMSASVGSFDSLSFFQVAEAVVDVLLWFSNFVQLPHWDYPRVNQEVLAGETDTVPGSPTTGTVISKKYNPVPRLWKPGRPRLVAWLWKVISLIWDLALDQTDDRERKLTEFAGLSDTGPQGTPKVAQFNDQQRTIAQLGAAMRRLKKRFPTEGSKRRKAT